MKKTLLIAVVLFMVLIPVCYGREETNVTDITQDARVNEIGAGPPAYTRDQVATTVILLDSPSRKGYIEFNISAIGIPGTGIIDEVLLTINYENTADVGANLTLWSMTKQPSALPDNNASNFQIWTDIGNGTIYDEINSTLTPTRRTRSLDGAEAIINFTSGFFMIGMQGDTVAGFVNVSASESTLDPVLSIKWHLAADIPYVFSGPFFENGNLTTAIIVTAAIESGNEEFLVNGTTPMYFPVEPLIFYWDLGGGTTRRIYSIGSENFTITIPDDDFDTYTFTVRDFTNKLSKGDGYLEAWRIVSTNDTLIERQIVDVHNEVPLNLVVGATYTLRVRFYDNSTFEWGFFVPGQTLTSVIILRGVEITDQAYLVGNFLFVEITRPITTQVTVDYLTTRNTTIWSNVTVLIRNGAVIATQSFNNESYTYNFGGLNANTSYVVLVNGEHSLQTEWAYSRTFDGTETYPDVPNIELIFPMGNLPAGNLIAWIFTLAGGLTFSVVYRRAALIVMCALGSFFATFGFADWNFYLLSLCWFFSIVVYLGSGDK